MKKTKEGEVLKVNLLSSCVHLIVDDFLQLFSCALAFIHLIFIIIPEIYLLVILSVKSDKTLLPKLLKTRSLSKFAICFDVAAHKNLI